MALVEGCKHSLDISVPVDAVQAETQKVVDSILKKAKLPGFRPGKAPAALIRKQFEGDIRQQVVENLVPKFLDAEVEKENLHLVGRPNISDLHFHDGEPLKFKAEFEVAPEVELGEYRGLEVEYQEPQVSDEDVNNRIEQIRNDKAAFANEEPRVLVDGDYAVLALESISGVDEPVKSDELMIQIGGAETLTGFSDGLRGMSPGEEKDIEVTYPDDYGQEKLSGKTVKFHMVVKGLRRKELPELNDEFAQDLGDYRTLDELKDSVRKGIFGQRQSESRQAAKDKLVEKLVDSHAFAVPDVFVDTQIQNRMEQRLRTFAAQGMDVSKLNLDWPKLRESQKDSATREVRASLLLGKISERENIAATRDEVDKEVEAIARQRREPVPATRMRLEKEGTMGRIASHIQTEKTLDFLFEQAVKTAS